MSLRNVLLAVVSKHPDTGYGLKRRLRDDLSHIWHARLQQVYRELGRLHEEGLMSVESVAQHNRPDKKVYSITQAGADALDVWLAQPVPPPVTKNEGFARILCIDRAPRPLAERQLALRKEQWERHLEELQTKLSRAQDLGEFGLGYLLTLEAALAQAEAKVRWCGRALERLAAAPPVAGANGASPTGRHGAAAAASGAH